MFSRASHLVLPLLTNRAGTILRPAKANSSTFKSALSLSNLYPTSSLNFTTPPQVPESNDSKFNGFIPIDKLQITYSRSSAPGGQHVNTTNSKVDVRFHVQSAEWLDPEIRSRILEKCKSRINKDGFLVVRSEKTRSQMYNQADAVTALRELIRAVAINPEHKPSEETLHMLRKRKERANMERLRQKKMRSLTKASRQNSDY